jgi:hypothetical protein
MKALTFKSSRKHPRKLGFKDRCILEKGKAER